MTWPDLLGLASRLPLRPLGQDYTFFSGVGHHEGLRASIQHLLCMGPEEPPLPKQGVVHGGSQGKHQLCQIQGKYRQVLDRKQERGGAGLPAGVRVWGGGAGKRRVGGGLEKGAGPQLRACGLTSPWDLGTLGI